MKQIQLKVKNIYPFFDSHIEIFVVEQGAVVHILSASSSN
jgi:hypothetical protein